MTASVATAGTSRRAGREVTAAGREVAAAGKVAAAAREVSPVHRPAVGGAGTRGAASRRQLRNDDLVARGEAGGDLHLAGGRQAHLDRRVHSLAADDLLDVRAAGAAMKRRERYDQRVGELLVDQRGSDRRAVVQTGLRAGDVDDDRVTRRPR